MLCLTPSLFTCVSLILDYWSPSSPTPYKLMVADLMVPILIILENSAHSIFTPCEFHSRLDKVGSLQAASDPMLTSIVSFNGENCSYFSKFWSPPQNHEQPECNNISMCFKLAQYRVYGICLINVSWIELIKLSKLTLIFCIVLWS